MTEGEVVGWHHRLDGHESEQTPGHGQGQGGLACCRSWRHKESDTTEQLNKNKRSKVFGIGVCMCVCAHWLLNTSLCL